MSNARPHPGPLPQERGTEPLLPLFEVDKESENVRWLEDYLRVAKGWMTGRELEVLVGREKHEGRWVRALAQQSDWVISGQLGYKHLEHAPAEEINHFVNWMESQGKRMIGRAERVKRNAHRALQGKTRDAAGTDCATNQP